MPAIVYRMGGIKCRLEDDARLHFAGHIIIVVARSVIQVVLVAKGVVCGTCGGEAGRGRACRRLKLAGALPFRLARQPEHEPVIGEVLWGLLLV